MPPNLDAAHASPRPPARRAPIPNAARRAVTDRAGPVRRCAPATCGELVQGAIDGIDFLVNCPIDRWSVAEVARTSEPGLHVDGGDRFAKVRCALELLGVPDDGGGYRVGITSDVPRGKGMASSSADLAAALAAVAHSAGLSPSPTMLARLVASIEPSDCVHLPGIAHVDHLRGTVVGCLPAPVGLGVVVVDCGGEIDTVAFDREHARAVYREEQATVAAVLARLKRGLRSGNLKDIAAAATASARLSQRILPKPRFEALRELARTHSALGINCAHSGTVLGVLHRTGEGVAKALAFHIERRFGTSLPVIGAHTVIGGGCRGC